LRFKPRPLTCGSAVPPAPSDIAQMLEVVWRPDVGVDAEHAMVAGHSITVLRVTNGDVVWSRLGPDRGTAGHGMCAGKGHKTVAEAKKAAIRALASHLAQQVSGGFDTIGSAAGARAVEAGEGPATFAAGGYRAGKSARQEVEAKAACATIVQPSPARAFRVGDKVRLTAAAHVDVSWHRRWHGEFVVAGEQRGREIPCTASDGCTGAVPVSDIEHVSEPAPLPAPPSASGWSPKKGDRVVVTEEWLEKGRREGWAGKWSGVLIVDSLWSSGNVSCRTTDGTAGSFAPKHLLPAPSLTGGAAK